jgi:hypothetical protein
METKQILTELRAERARIDQAIEALEALNGMVTVAPKAAAVAKPAGKRGPREMSPAARKHMSEMMKARWAARKGGQKAAKAPAKAAKAPKTASAAGTTGRQMSAAARKRISEAAKKRWAERKKAKA